MAQWSGEDTVAEQRAEAIQAGRLAGYPELLIQWLPLPWDEATYFDRVREDSDQLSAWEGLPGNPYAGMTNMPNVDWDSTAMLTSGASLFLRERPPSRRATRSSPLPDGRCPS